MQGLGICCIIRKKRTTFAGDMFISRYKDLRKYGLVFACMMAVSQYVGAQEYFSSASDFARLYVGAVEAQYQKTLWHDIPYYNGNTNLYKGRISYSGVVYDDVQLRFDQFKQCVVVLPPGEKVMCVPDQGLIDWFEMDGHRYVHDPEDSTRYAYLLSDGSTNGIRLYHSVWKINSGDRNVGVKKYVKTLSTQEHYTLITPDGEMHHVKRASDVAKLFPAQKKPIKQFARKNHLSFSRKERERSLAKLTESVSGTPMPTSSGDRQEVRGRRIVHHSPLPDVKKPTESTDAPLVAGIPVLDNDSVALAVTSKRNKTRTYIVPGVKKARASIADDQELDEIVVVGGRPSAVNNMMMGSEKFKPILLKNIPSAFGESDIM